MCSMAQGATKSKEVMGWGWKGARNHSLLDSRDFSLKQMIT